MGKKKNDFLFAIVFGLHYFGFAEDRLRLNNGQEKIVFFLPLCSACTIFVATN